MMIFDTEMTKYRAIVSQIGNDCNGYTITEEDMDKLIATAKDAPVEIRFEDEVGHVLSLVRDKDYLIAEFKVDSKSFINEHILDGSSQPCIGFAIDKHDKSTAKVTGFLSLGICSDPINQYPTPEIIE